MSMNIYSKKEDKVIFNNPTNGYLHDQKKAKKYLTVGKIYTVEKTIVDSFHTDVILQEFPKIEFNSVLFSDLKEE